MGLMHLPFAPATPRPRWRRVTPWAVLLLALAGLALTAQQALERRTQRALVRAEMARAQAQVQEQARQGPRPQPAAAPAEAGASAAGLLPPGAAPALRFARAQALVASGQLDTALSQYRGLQDDPLLGAPARFNAANALMRRALALREAGQAHEAYPMVELAKAGYRELLRRQPGDADARYNLERALRLNPEQPVEELSAAAPARGERAATTMKAVSQGLP